MSRLSLRSSAVRALSSATHSSVSQSGLSRRSIVSFTSAIHSLSAAPAQQRLSLPSLASRRCYATNDSDKSSVLDSVRDAASQASAKVGEVAEAATSFVSNSKGRTEGHTREPLESVDRPFAGSNPGGARYPPSESLYVGNLYFEVQEDTLRREFEKYGEVLEVNIIKDERGMSKG